MELRLNNQEAEIIRAALTKHIRGLNNEMRPHCAGYSPIGIGLCRDRAVAEALLDRVQVPDPHWPAAMAA